jgi:hypothetical protein
MYEQGLYYPPHLELYPVVVVDTFSYFVSCVINLISSAVLGFGASLTDSETLEESSHSSRMKIKTKCQQF